jgi:hypothetical protein
MSGAGSANFSYPSTHKRGERICREEKLFLP